MFLSAKAFFEDHTQDNIRLLVRAETEFPAEWLRTFRKNVLPLTPKKIGYLRRSIITQVLGKTGSVSWRAPYAKAQDDGGHTVRKIIKGPNQRDGGYGIILPKPYRYSNYTTAGTGSDFARKAATATHKQVPGLWRKLGLTK